MTHDEKEKIIHTILNDFDAETDDFFAWTNEVSASDVKRNLMTKFNVAIGDVINLKASKRGPSGRIVKLLVEGSNGNIVIGKELNIRRLLSDSHLYSSAFEAEKIINDKGEIIFRLVGRGWGHGVGLCQIGAAIMAERGYSYIDILKHYYKGVKLEKIY
jgi:SpoIID/LytB domain protein